MKGKLMWLLLMALLVPVPFFVAHYLTHRRLEPWTRSDAKELVWLRTEFHLDDAAYSKVRALHDAYEPHCMELCSAIRDADAAVAKLSHESTSLTPELRAAIEKADRVSRECHMAMREHLYQVARVMPPAEARRFLDMMEQRFHHATQMALEAPPRATSR
jgi:hypothetical protein